MGDEAFNPVFKAVLRREITVPKPLTNQDRKPDLDLVDQGSVNRREVESDAATGVAQKRLARGHPAESA
jgi:hypothetical protein